MEKATNAKLPYSIAEIQAKILPIAKAYKLKAVYLFGSYAREEADAKSDIDFLIDTDGSGLDSLFKLGGLYAELEEAFDCHVDMVTVASLMQKETYESQANFRNNVWAGKVDIYVAA